MYLFDVVRQDYGACSRTAPLSTGTIVFHTRILNNQIFRAAIVNVAETFANAMLQELDTCKIDFVNLWLSDETGFPMGSFVNKNWRILETENPVAVLHYIHHLLQTTH